MNSNTHSSGMDRSEKCENSFMFKEDFPSVQLVASENRESESPYDLSSDYSFQIKYDRTLKEMAQFFPEPESPVGVFDSGVGGLSVFREIRRYLPSEKVIYVADSGFAPYGNRSCEFIEKRAESIVMFLLSKGVKAIVVACNTVTVVAATKLRSWCPVPIIAMEPAIKPAASMTRSGVIAVLATSRTIASPSVSRLCSLYGNNIEVLLQPCPGLVEKVEMAELEAESTFTLISGYISPLVDRGADTIVLGCTHYPFLREAIGRAAGNGVTIIDPAAPVAKELARQLDLRSVTAPRELAGDEIFFASGMIECAKNSASMLLQKDVVINRLPDDFALNPS